MAKHDEEPSGAPLAEALSAALATGSLEAALQAARGYFMRHPGEGGAMRVVEAVELLMAQVWFGGAEEGEEPDARLTAAAQELARVNLEGALACYEAVGSHERRGDSASRLALYVRVLRAAASGAPLPSAPAPAVPVLASFDDTTRVAHDGELPLAAFDEDEVTSNVDPVIPAEAYPEEVTRHLVLGDYEIIEPADEEDERTRILQAHVPPPPRRAPPPPDTGDREVTRIAGAGELPLEELRRQMRAEEERAEEQLADARDASDELDRPTLPRVAERGAPPAPRPPVAGPPVVGPPVPPPPFLESATAPSALDAGSFDADEGRQASPPAPPRTPEPVLAAGSRSEISLAFVALPTPTTPESRPHRPSNPGAARDSSPSSPPLERASVPTPPPAPLPAPASMSAFRPDLLSAPPAPPAERPPSSIPAPRMPSSVPAPPPAPPPAAASMHAARPDLLASAPEVSPPSVRGPAVPPPPRGPAVPPPPPIAPVENIAPPAPAPPPSSVPDPVHAPLASVEVALPPASAQGWQIREPGVDPAGAPAEADEAFADRTWTGVRSYSAPPATFEPGLDPVDADTWGEPAAAPPPGEREAEALVARGELGEALRLYQELAIARPDEPHLWERVAEIARLMQNR